MLRLSKRLRFFFGCIALVALPADAWWLLHRPPREALQFKLKLTLASFPVSDKDVFPVYDRSLSQWSVNGNRVASLKPFLRVIPLPDVPHEVAFVGVAEPQSVVEVQATLVALVDQQICAAELVGDLDLDHSIVKIGSVFTIDWVRMPDGVKRKCHPKIGAT